MADSALRLISKTGREALDIENDMVRILGLVDWVRAIASKPKMHAMRRSFHLTAVAPPFIFGAISFQQERTEPFARRRLTCGGQQSRLFENMRDAVFSR